jgi:MoaA/NifB/PqqE/SkfB family radical SAM enzyme
MDIKFLIKRLRNETKGKYYSIKYSRRRIPTALVLETTTRCNANCIFCGREYLEKKGDIDIELAKKIIDVMPFASRVIPQGIGEPLLYPNIIELVKYAKAKKKEVVFYTNASKLDKEMSLKLIESGLDGLKFSVDEIFAEYEKIRRGLSFNKVYTNIVKFLELNKKAGNPVETWIYAVVNKDRDRRNVLKKFWKNLVDHIVFIPEAYFPTPIEIRKEAFIDCDSIPCDMLYNTLVVRIDGCVDMCCDDWYGQYIIDCIDKNVTTEEILNIFNSSIFEQLRERIAMGKRMPLICKSCVTRTLYEEKKHEGL